MLKLPAESSRTYIGPVPLLDEREAVDEDDGVDDEVRDGAPEAEPADGAQGLEERAREQQRAVGRGRNSALSGGGTGDWTFERRRAANLIFAPIVSVGGCTPCVITTKRKEVTVLRHIVVLVLICGLRSKSLQLNVLIGIPGEQS